MTRSARYFRFTGADGEERCTRYGATPCANYVTHEETKLCSFHYRQKRNADDWAEIKKNRLHAEAFRALFGDLDEEATAQRVAENIGICGGCDNQILACACRTPLFQTNDLVWLKSDFGPDLEGKIFVVSDGACEREYAVFVEEHDKVHTKISAVRLSRRA